MNIYERIKHIPMQQTPVSVVLPYYKAEDTICRAVESALHQTRPPAEILCINDGSPDGTRERLSAWRETLSTEQAARIKLIDQPENLGVYVARNRGLDEATQPYLAFLDADDFWHPQKLETQFRILEADPDLYFLSHKVDVWPEDKPIEFETLNTQDMEAQPINKHKVLWMSRLRTLSVVMKNTPKYRFDETKWRGGDNLMWLEVIWSGEKAAIIHETLAWKGKGHFGVAGLSGNIWKAELESQHSLSVLARKKLISRPYAAIIHVWFALKFLRRASIVGLRSISGK